MFSTLSLSLSDALTVVTAAQDRARELDLHVAVAVVDPGGHVIALQSMDHTQPAGAEVATAKARASVLFRRPTSAFEEASARLDKPAILLLPTAVPHALALGGGLPAVVTIDGRPTTVGALGVSGGAGHEDVDIAQHGLAALQTRADPPHTEPAQ